MPDPARSAGTGTLSYTPRHTKAHKEQGKWRYIVKDRQGPLGDALGGRIARLIRHDDAEAPSTGAQPTDGLTPRLAVGQRATDARISRIDAVQKIYSGLESHPALCCVLYQNTTLIYYDTPIRSTIKL